MPSFSYILENAHARCAVAFVLLIATSVAAYQAAAPFGYPAIVLHTATAASLATLFFLGVSRWWMVAIAAFIGALTAGLPFYQAMAWPLGQTAAAILGARALILLSLDPIFRKFRHMLSIILVSFAVSAVPPTARLLGEWYAHYALGGPLPSAGVWSDGYAGTVCAILIVTPFLLRWLSKRRFGRNLIEVAELTVVFGALIGLNYLIFYLEVSRFAGVSLVYFLLVPLFWIALRLRPRFVTLGFMVMGTMAVHSALLSPEGLERLFATEAFLIVLAIIFYVIVALEEDRRLNSNLMRHQLSTLENAVARISSESKAKNDFIAVLAHELRNPLAPVVSSIDLLKLKSDRDPEEMATLTMMEDRMQMVKRLLDDLLDISRITENKLRVKDEPVNLDEVIRHAILSTEHYRKERHQAFSYKTTEEPLIVAGDSARLEQVVSNLLTNASKYTDPGGSISLMLTRTGDHARIHVKDKGIGIDPVMIETVFTPFHQIDSGKRSIKGLGIGLALVRSFVEMHGGTVEARSEGVGHGSEFVVTLPLLSGGAADAPEETSEEPVRRTKRLSVLIVDDNDSAGSTIGKLLEIQGHTALYAYDGEQALTQALTKRPDLILLDLDLPDMSGYEVARRLKAKGFTGRLVALTGLSTADTRIEGAKLGFEEYLVKPVGIEELKRALHKKVAK